MMLYISEICKIDENVRRLVKGPTSVHYHHHYYCKCHPTTQDLDLKYDQTFTEQLKNGEIHHHYVHPVAESLQGMTHGIPDTIKFDDKDLPAYQRIEMDHQRMDVNSQKYSYVPQDFKVQQYQEEFYGDEMDISSQMEISQNQKAQNPYSQPHMPDISSIKEEPQKNPNLFEQIEWPPFLQELPQRFQQFELNMETQHPRNQNSFQNTLNDIHSSFTNMFKPKS